MMPIENRNIAVVGGGRRCRALLQAIFSEEAAEKRPKILGVADIDEQAVGIKYAKQKGVFTTRAYHVLFSLKDLELVIDLTGDDRLLALIRAEKPPGVLLVDHDEAQSLLDYFRIKGQKSDILKRMRTTDGNRKSVEALFEAYRELGRYY